MTPRYRYKKAFITSPKLAVPTVSVIRVSEGIAMLSALGNGSLILQCEPQRDWGKCHIPQIRFGIGFLRRKSESEIWTMYDAEVDVARARLFPFNGRQVEPSAMGRWPQCPGDILKVIDEIDTAGVLRLRHFAALLIADIRIVDRHFAMHPRERAAADAQLTDVERVIAFRAIGDSAVRDLLWLR